MVKIGVYGQLAPTGMIWDEEEVKVLSQRVIQLEADVILIQHSKDSGIFLKTLKTG
jgi:hypothetical protein